MSHTGTLLMNCVRESLKKLSRKGVGYIDGEREDKVYYRIDGRLFVVGVNERVDCKNE